MEGKSKVSIIIPVYGVEKYIERCARSLFEQTYKNIEYIFVDDATPDNSITVLKRILEEYPDRKGSTVIVSHSFNKGLPAARNTGMQRAEGEYVFHCDSDDFLENNAIELLINKCIETNSDWVYCDFFLSFTHNERRLRLPEYNNASLSLRSLLAGEMKYNVWNKLIRRSLYDGICFPEGRSMGEDMTIIKVVSNASSTAYVNKPLYHYAVSSNSAMSHVYDDAKLQSLFSNTLDTVDYIKSNHPEVDQRTINWFLLNVKLPFLFSGNSSYYKKWKFWFPEANKDIFSNKFLPLRTRFIQSLARCNCFRTISFYNFLVNNFIYGVIFR